MSGTIGLIGCGSMGTALVRGIVSARLVRPSQIRVWDVRAAQRNRLVRQLKVRAARTAREAAGADLLLLAVKPQQMEGLLAEIRPAVGRRSLVVSVAAGIRTDWIARRLGGGIRVVRVMPNTPALVGAGMSVLSGGRSAKPVDLKRVERLLACVGEVLRLPERRMDAVTALSGSGPAYFFFLMERMIAAGRRLGIPAAAARRLTVQTALGAARLAAESGEEPAALRQRVTSKKGTTEAALKQFQKSAVGAGIERGVLAAARRSRELSR